MEEIINKIIKLNSNLFGDNPIVEKINVGFTNTIYNVNNSFIVKICTNNDNESEFAHEINFYKENKNNDLIPKLYFASTDKTDIPYFYEIIEKVEGISLYNVWHTFSEDVREDIIRQLCDAMKQMHSVKGESYDWIDKNKNEFNSLYEKAKKLNIFNDKEIVLLDNAYSKFDEYLKSDEFVLVHNDLHFDNIFSYTPLSFSTFS